MELTESKITLFLIDFPAFYITDELKEKLSVIFKRKVSVKEIKFNLEKFLDPVREQYYSTGILKEFIFNKPVKNGDKVCILTREDLYIPVLTFVFGEAHMHGEYCIVSSFRLREEFYSREENLELFGERLLKEIVHELGHTFGLTHCINDKCVMHNSFNIEDTDRKSIYPCESCFEELDKVL